MNKYQIMSNNQMYLKIVHLKFEYYRWVTVQQKKKSNLSILIKELINNTYSYIHKISTQFERRKDDINNKKVWNSIVKTDRVIIKMWDSSLKQLVTCNH